MKQNKLNIVDYYTFMSSFCEELDAMNALHVIITSTIGTIALLRALHMQKEESKLFYFLNGLYDVYSSIRSQLFIAIF